MVLWLGLSAFTAGAWVQSLVRELRSHKPCGEAKNNNNNNCFVKRKFARDKLILIYRWQGDWGLHWPEIYFGIVLSNMLTAR